MATAIEILKADKALIAIFLLRNAGDGNGALTDENAARFLLWFALEGRSAYHHVTVSPDYIAFLSSPVPPFTTRLAAYVLMRRGDIRKKFGSDPDAFHAWYYLDGLQEMKLGIFVTPREQRFLAEMHPHFKSGDSAPLSRREYYAFLRSQEARDAFDLARAEDRERFLTWLGGGRDLLDLPWLGPPAPADNSALPGVNIVGFADGVLGIGEDARALSRVLGHGGVTRAIMSVSLSEKNATNDTFATRAISIDRPLFPVNIFSLTAFETARLYVEYGANLFEGRYNIGYWPWELTSLPPHWRWVFDLVDEIWAPSDFLVDVYSGLTDKPVVRMPFYLNVPSVERIDLKQFGLHGDEIVFMTMFDFNSYVARKNPVAAIRAFKAAFPDSNGAERMIVKTLNAHAHAEALRAIEAELGEDDRFVLIDGPFSRAEVCGLISAVDCFVSLHRSEGFGRVMAEAMLLQTTVVATNWSGNTTFLDAEVGYPVGFALRDVGPDEYIFSDGSQWAEPSIEDAVKQLRLMRSRIPNDAPLRQRARERVNHQHGLDAVARNVAARLAKIAA